MYMMNTMEKNAIWIYNIADPSEVIDYLLDAQSTMKGSSSYYMDDSGSGAFLIFTEESDATQFLEREHPLFEAAMCSQVFSHIHATLTLKFREAVDKLTSDQREQLAALQTPDQAHVLNGSLEQLMEFEATMSDIMIHKSAESGSFGIAVDSGEGRTSETESGYLPGNGVNTGRMHHTDLNVFESVTGKLSPWVSSAMSFTDDKREQVQAEADVTITEDSGNYLVQCSSLSHLQAAQRILFASVMKHKSSLLPETSETPKCTMSEEEDIYQSSKTDAATGIIHGKPSISKPDTAELTGHATEDSVHGAADDADENNRTLQGIDKQEGGSLDSASFMVLKEDGISWAQTSEIPRSLSIEEDIYESSKADTPAKLESGTAGFTGLIGNPSANVPADAVDGRMDTRQRFDEQDQENGSFDSFRVTDDPESSFVLVDSKSKPGELDSFSKYGAERDSSVQRDEDEKDLLSSRDEESTKLRISSCDEKETEELSNVPNAVEDFASKESLILSNTQLEVQDPSEPLLTDHQPNKENSSVESSTDRHGLSEGPDTGNQSSGMSDVGQVTAEALQPHVPAIDEDIQMKSSVIKDTEMLEESSGNGMNDSQPTSEETPFECDNQQGQSDKTNNDEQCEETDADSDATPGFTGNLQSDDLPGEEEKMEIFDDREPTTIAKGHQQGEPDESTAVSPVVDTDVQPGNDLEQEPSMLARDPATPQPPKEETSGDNKVVDYFNEGDDSVSTEDNDHQGEPDGTTAESSVVDTDVQPGNDLEQEPSMMARDPVRPEPPLVPESTKEEPSDDSKVLDYVDEQDVPKEDKDQQGEPDGTNAESSVVDTKLQPVNDLEHEDSMIARDKESISATPQPPLVPESVKEEPSGDSKMLDDSVLREDNDQQGQPDESTDVSSVVVTDVKPENDLEQETPTIEGDKESISATPEPPLMPESVKEEPSGDSKMLDDSVLREDNDQQGEPDGTTTESSVVDTDEQPENDLEQETPTIARDKESLSATPQPLLVHESTKEGPSGDSKMLDHVDEGDDFVPKEGNDQQGEPDGTTTESSVVDTDEQPENDLEHEDAMMARGPAAPEPPLMPESTKEEPSGDRKLLDYVSERGDYVPKEDKDTRPNDIDVSDPPIDRKDEIPPHDEVESAVKDTATPNDTVDLDKCLETLEYFHKTPEGIAVTIKLDDITQQNTDVIVNAANTSLQHGGGVAKAIVSAGGKQIQTESRRIIKKYGELDTGTVCHTSAGKLNSKHIIHAVAPIWREDRKFAEDMLHVLLLKVFSYASKSLKAKSLAIPAIGAGLYGMPIELCAKIFHTAIRDFSAKRDENTVLEDIRIILYDVEATGEFLIEFCNAVSSESPTASGYVALRDVDPGISTAAAPPDATAAAVSTPRRGVVRLSTKVKSASPAVDRASIAGPLTDRGDCQICTETGVKLMSMNCCQNTICGVCFNRHFENDGKCPFCTAVVLMMKGTQPRGQMDFQHNKNFHLPGYEKDGTIVIGYDFPNGIQQKCHPNPGKRYYGTRRTAFLPASGQGLQVLALLKMAFDHGFVFTIGRSVTTGVDDCVIWNDIHHKTSVSGGPANYGYPDPTYLDRVKAELAAKGFQ